MLPHTRLKALFSLDTLDTRFTVSAKTPIQAAKVEHGTDPSRPAIARSDAEPDRSVQAKARPSKWRTNEYYFYYAVFLGMVPVMFWVPYNVSKGKSLRTLTACSRDIGSRSSLHVSKRSTISKVRAFAVRWLDTRTQSRMCKLVLHA